jgi:hypothetical protein
VGETAPETPAPRFQIIEGFAHPIIQRYQRFIAENGIRLQPLPDRRGFQVQTVL